MGPTLFWTPNRGNFIALGFLCECQVSCWYVIHSV